MSEQFDPQGSGPEHGPDPVNPDAGVMDAGETAPEGPRGFAAVVGPFLNAIVAPGDCFKALDARPVLSVWIAVWIAVLSTIMAVVNLPITRQAMFAVARSQIQASGNEVTPEQLQQSQQLMATIGTVIAYASSIFLIVMIALTALLIWVMAAIMGGKRATFGRSFGVAAAAGVVRPLLYSLYATIILQMNPPEIRRAEDLATMTPTLGLDLILSGPGTPAWLNALFQHLDLFSLWWMVLVVLGSMVVLKVSKAQGIVIAVVLWLIGTLFAMGGAAMQALSAG